MEMEQVLELIKTISDSPLTEFEYDANGVKIALKKEKPTTVVTTAAVGQNCLEPMTVNPLGMNPVAGAAMTGSVMPNGTMTGAVAPGVVTGASNEAALDEPVGNIVKSPLVGRFYAAPAEDAEPFVKVGDTVSVGQVLAIVEAMKLMNDIESDYSGQVAEVFVKNGEAVEYGQPLFRIV